MTSKNPVKVTLKFLVSGYALIPNDADFSLIGSASLKIVFSHQIGSDVTQ